MKFCRLDRLDGTFVLTRSPTEDRFDEVRAYHLELLNEVREFEGYYHPSADPILFEEYRFCYEAIASLLYPQFNPGDLASQSRHQFFVATDPVPHPEAPDKLTPGVSMLEGLMGFGYGNAGSEPLITTGDSGLDLRAMLLLNFKEQVPWLVANHTREELALILRQASEMQDPEFVKQKQRTRDRDNFEAQAGAIAAQLENMGIELPEGF